MTIDGFYYGHNGEYVTKMKAAKRIMKLVNTELVPKLAKLSFEDYWENYAVGMITHAPQGYLAVNGTSLWILDDGELRVVEFTHKSLRGLRIDSPHDDDDDNPYYDLVYTPWDWQLEDNCKGKRVSKKEMSIIDENVDWTHALHEKLNKIKSLESLA